jgi:hypothetical protein
VSICEQVQIPYPELTFFRKVLHDVRECLTTYRGCVEIVVTKKEDYSATTLRLVTHWDNIVSDWYAQTLTLSEHHGKYDSASREWAKHIAEVGEIIQDAAVFQVEIESIAQPETTEEAKQLIRIAKRSAATLDFRAFTNGQGVQKAHAVIRKYVEHLDVDRPLYPDHNQMKALVASGEILDEVEKTIGSLE